MLDAVILSDLHLGSDNCQAKKVAQFLELIKEGDLKTARVILNGDVFDSIDFRRLNKHHWKVLSLIRSLSNDLEIIWLCGNHDGSVDTFSHLLGVTFMDEFVLESGSERILVLHGHTFDSFIDQHPILTWVGDCIYAFLQWVDKSHSIARLAKRRSKTFMRCARKVETLSADYARRRNCSIVCCGHTHAAGTTQVGPVTCCNSGCWTELPCHYLTVWDGLVEVQRFAPDEVTVEVPSREPSELNPVAQPVA
jgi:UDP-2,3-diacylglucosamine pyrophosphatase LpxH